MAASKISAKTTDSAPDRTADYAPTYNASDPTKTYKVLLSKFGAYWMSTYIASFSPADATSYYSGPFPGVAGTSAANNRLYVPRAGLVTKIRLFFIQSVVGTTETSTVAFRLNDTTDTTISSAVNLSASPYTVVNSALSIAVAEDDYFCIKWTTPTWATNPTGVIFSAQIFVT